MRTVVIGGALWLAACSAEPRVTLGDEQVAIAVVVDAADGVVDQRWFDASTGAHVAVPDDDALLVFAFSREAFELRGEASWRDHYPTITLDPSACGACLLPQGRAPQPVLPGEVCPIPYDTEASIHQSGGDDTARLAALRAKARLVWGEPLCPRVGRVGPSNGAPGMRYDDWLAGSGPAVERIYADGDAAAQPLDAAFLGRFDLLLIEWPVRTFTSTESRALDAWVRAGGGFVSTSGFSRDRSEPQRINSLLSALDLEYVGPMRDGPIAAFDAHPVTRGVGYLEFSGGFGVRSSGAVLARTAEGPVGNAVERDRGRAVLWGDEWILANFSFDGSDNARTFWSQAIVWAAGRSF